MQPDPAESSSTNSAIIYWPAENAPNPPFVTAVSTADLAPIAADGTLTDRALCRAKIRGQEYEPCVLVWLSEDDTVEQLKQELLNNHFEKRYITKGRQYWEESKVQQMKTFSPKKSRAKTPKSNPTAVNGGNGAASDEQLANAISANAVSASAMTEPSPPARRNLSRRSMPANVAKAAGKNSATKPKAPRRQKSAGVTKARSAPVPEVKRGPGRPAAALKNGTGAQPARKRGRGRKSGAMKKKRAVAFANEAPKPMSNSAESAMDVEEREVAEPASNGQMNDFQGIFINPRDVLTKMLKQHNWGVAFGVGLRGFFSNDEIINGYFARPRKNEAGQKLDVTRVEKLKELLETYCMAKKVKIPEDKEIGRKFA
ncbi:uncharacterized protein LOC129591629 isoform X2 [Paramacrobiotus metropolitanus]|nr:uncharacterized protein LOC129591629 isoform X2 [Paramacrobiotus metropolitanus]